MFKVITENAPDVFAKPGLEHWHKIDGPYGLSFQAYLNHDEAVKVADKLNSKPYFDYKAFCKEVRDRKNIERLNNVL